MDDPGLMNQVDQSRGGSVSTASLELQLGRPLCSDHLAIRIAIIDHLRANRDEAAIDYVMMPALVRAAVRGPKLGGGNARASEAT